MTATGLALGSLALATEPELRRSRIRGRDVATGLASAAALYGVFMVGDRMVRRLLERGGEDIGDVYALRQLGPVPELAARLALVIGPAEELFWRGFVNARLQRRLGRWPGAAAGSFAYAGAHVATGNFTLFGAAGEATRHNLGARTVRLLAERDGADLLPDPVGALVGQASGPPSLELAIPQTGMNDCGPVDLIVIHDELDLPVGRLKVKVGGGRRGRADRRRRRRGGHDLVQHAERLSAMAESACPAGAGGAAGETTWAYSACPCTQGGDWSQGQAMRVARLPKEQGSGSCSARPSGYAYGRSPPTISTGRPATAARAQTVRPARSRSASRAHPPPPAAPGRPVPLPWATPPSLPPPRLAPRPASPPWATPPRPVPLLPPGHLEVPERPGISGRCGVRGW